MIFSENRYTLFRIMLSATARQNKRKAQAFRFFFADSGKDWVVLLQQSPQRIEQKRAAIPSARQRRRPAAATMQPGRSTRPPGEIGEDQDHNQDHDRGNEPVGMVVSPQP
jgi:hypothetical protein